MSSVSQRAELARALDYLRDNDTLVVTKLDRLARSVKDLLSIVKSIQSKGSHLKILAMDLDTSSSHGRLVLQLLGAIAEFERAPRRAQALGKYRGRKPTARARKEEIVNLLKEGHGATVVARKLGIARSSVYRIASDG